MATFACDQQEGWEQPPPEGAKISENHFCAQMEPLAYRPNWDLVSQTGTPWGNKAQPLNPFPGFVGSSWLCRDAAPVSSNGETEAQKEALAVELRAEQSSPAPLGPSDTAQGQTQGAGVLPSLPARGPPAG